MPHVVSGRRSAALCNRYDVRALSQVDAKIVEVALFFQNELAAAAAGGPAGGASGCGVDQPAMSVVLLSGDNAQLSLARSHGRSVMLLSDRSQRRLANATCKCDGVKCSVTALLDVWSKRLYQEVCPHALDVKSQGFQPQR